MGNVYYERQKNIMKWTAPIGYFDYAVCVDGVIVANRLSLAKAKQEAKKWEANIFNQYIAEIIIYNSTLNKSILYQHGS